MQLFQLITLYGKIKLIDLVTILTATFSMDSTALGTTVTEFPPTAAPPAGG